MQFEDRTFENESIELDGRYFVRCRFINCRLSYSGTDGFGLQQCSFDPPNLSFEGAAGKTLSTLQALSDPHSGLAPLVAKALPHLVAPVGPGAGPQIVNVNVGNAEKSGPIWQEMLKGGAAEVGRVLVAFIVGAAAGAFGLSALPLG